MATEWTDELKAEVVAAYEEREPTPETTADIIAELAEEFEKTPNGVRIILSKAGVYVKKAASPSASKSTGSARVSKADAIATLTAVIEAEGGNIDEEILSKLTGKAAVYFTEVIKTITAGE
jgi:hypothetical protein